MGEMLGFLAFLIVAVVCIPMLISQRSASKRRELLGHQPPLPSRFVDPDDIALHQAQRYYSIAQSAVRWIEHELTRDDQVALFPVAERADAEKIVGSFYALTRKD